MRHEFKLQDPGEGVHEVEVEEVLVAEGDSVSEGDDVLVVESDKAAIELPSPFSGRIAEMRVAVGDIVEVGEVLMVIDDAAEEVAEETEEVRDTGETRAAEASGSDAAAPDEERSNAEDAAEEERSSRRDAEGDAPQASKQARQDTRDTDGRSRGERERETGARGKAEEGARGPMKAAPAAPAARKRARDAGLDLQEIEPSGKEGQITLSDVEAALGGADDAEAGTPERADAATGRAEPEDSGAGEAADDTERDAYGPVERVNLRSIRAATARAMARSWAEIPHVVHQDLADITDLEIWRREMVEEQDDETLTLTPFLAKAAAAALRRHPRFNATYNAEAGEIVLRRYCNINIAVATKRGLITPVVRDVDRKPPGELAHEIDTLSRRMREGRPSKEDLAGGTFTITNVGGLGGTGFAPLINPPQCAILGFAKARLTPVVEGDLSDLDGALTTVRLMLPVVVAFDHRLNDGADAAHFVNDLAALLADPKSFALAA